MNNFQDLSAVDLANKIRDHKFFLENFCKVKTKEYGLQPFILKEAQKDLFNEMRRNNRIIILKARQLGFSTAIAGFFYVDTITRPGILSVLVGYNADMTRELLDKIKTFHLTTPKKIRPEVKYDSKFEFSFPKMNSKILVLPCTKDVGRSLTIQNLLVTELSSWEDAEEKMAGLQESVPSGGRIIVESTPRGIGNLYHRMWMNDNNGYIKKKYGWEWEYAKEWAEKKKKEMDPMFWAQEYGLEFLASGRCVFDQQVIREQQRNILEVGNLRKMDGKEDFMVRKIDDWMIYEKLDPNGLYIIGADIADGIAGGDYSVAVIWNRKTGEESAMFRKIIPPDIFGEILDKWGRMYNNALMVPEVNSGKTVLNVLKSKSYPNFYFRKGKEETLNGGFSDRIGWVTSWTNRSTLMQEFSAALRNKLLIVHSDILLNEMSSVVYDDDNNIKAQSGCHDDSVFAAAIGFQGFKIMWDKPLEQYDYNKFLLNGFPY